MSHFEIPSSSYHHVQGQENKKCAGYNDRAAGSWPGSYDQLPVLTLVVTCNTDNRQSAECLDNVILRAGPRGQEDGGQMRDGEDSRAPVTVNITHILHHTLHLQIDIKTF